MLELSDAVADYVRRVSIDEPAPLAALREETEGMENAHWASSPEQGALAFHFSAELLCRVRSGDCGSRLARLSSRSASETISPASLCPTTPQWVSLGQ